jgi:hypothetical protein
MVIKTIEASNTPKASKPVLIWPNAMLSSVVAAVAAPINIGMGKSAIWVLANASM